ncbi:MAG: hypothetical protein OEZ39_20045 [Gammaproteobacteria bacterium]|nr:hypothetical protein [Gammaproteobacteria bacterium]MDH5654161.1 hypothetical protein [Gammaproteobacteria bacterium]
MERRCKNIFVLPAILLSILLAGCTTVYEKAGKYADQGEWLKVISEYRKALNKNPHDIEIRSLLIQSEDKAAEYYYTLGEKFLNEGDMEQAINQFRKGLIAKPKHDKLEQMLNVAIARREAQHLYNEGVSNMKVGKLAAAEHIFQQALDIYPNNTEIKNQLKEVRLRIQEARTTKFVLKSKNPITLNFKSTKLRIAFEFLAKHFGINIIFDDSVKDSKITLFAQGVTFEQGLNLILKTSDTFYKKLGPNTILIAPDTKEKRGQYEDHIIRTFHLKSITAKEMADIIKGVVTTKKVIINPQMNSLMVRDTQEVLSLIEKLVAINDRKPAEVVLEVEILEVNRNKAEQIGLDYGSVISAKYDEYSPSTSSLSATLKAGTVTLPNITFRYFKQDVDANTLANPKIRVINGKTAKIHIGDRVPLRSSTIQDATGQTRTTFEYTDIGIRLQVDPQIHFDNTITVKMNLEVSSLGQNLGTPDEPTFSIGTRNAETYMHLRDGETAVLGGLIRDEDRRNTVKVPGLGDIPVLGALFSSSDTSVVRTDVLLTITPKIIRATDISPRAMHSIYSGTSDHYSSKPLFGAFTGEKENGGQLTVKMGKTTTDSVQQTDDPTRSKFDTQDTEVPILSFDKPMYQLAQGELIKVALTVDKLPEIDKLPIGILYNPDLVKFTKYEPSGAIQGTEKHDDKKGMLQIEADVKNKLIGKGEKTVGYIVLQGLKKGVSYLTYRAPSIKSTSGEQIDVQIRASRIVIK